ncbi:MAG: formylmethanofuran dehydrogenase [Desulfobacterales bacterium]|nr:formylmethanofuran dehydrogenase [Desulfobacterales bacterium]
MENIKSSIPDDLKECISFHGHLCPGLVYGYLIAKQAINLLDLKRSADEEVVAVCENDSCAVDALQILLGTTAGKGNLIIKDYGKNAYTIFNRSNEKAYRFSRTDYYKYEGEYKDEFALLEKAVSSGSAGEHEKLRHKLLKAKDLLSKPFEEVFLTSQTKCAMPPFAPLARSESCAECGEMTMSTKMSADENGKLVCIPCSTE